MITVVDIHKKDILYKDEEGDIRVTTDWSNPEIKEALKRYYGDE